VIVQENLFKRRQTRRNHRAKIRWGSEVKGAMKPSITGEVALPEPASSDQWMGPVHFHPPAR